MLDNNKVLSIFFITFMFSVLVNILLIYISSKLQIAMDGMLKNHRIHKIPTPRIGGLGFVVSSSLTMLLFDIGSYSFLVSLLAFIIGFIEDLTNSLKPKLRLSLIAFVSFIVIIILHGKKNILINYIGFDFEFPYLISVAFTIFAITGITNAMNIIDGINGLSSGISLIIMFFMLWLAEAVNDILIFKIILVMFASMTGFFVINFFTGRIFLGDGGAYFTGFFLAVISSYMANTYKNISPWFFIILFWYPITDTIFSIYRRAIKNKNYFYSDMLHMHTLLCKRVFKNHIKASLCLLIINFIFSYMGFIFVKNTTILIFLFLCYTLIYIQVYLYFIRFRT